MRVTVRKRIDGGSGCVRGVRIGERFLKGFGQGLGIAMKGVGEPRIGTKRPWLFDNGGVIR